MKKNRKFKLFIAVLLITSSLVLTAPASSSTSESKKTDKVTFNFVDVDISAVTKFISDITGKNFIFDEKVKGKITIIAPSKLSSGDAFNLFTSVLEIKGFTVVPSGVDVYKIVPVAEAKQKGLQLSTDGLPLNESSVARLLTLKNISSEEALKFLQPLISKDGHISSFGPGNFLLIVDSGLNIEKLLSIIDFIDRPSTTDKPELITLKFASADAVAKLLNDGIGKAQAQKRGRPLGQQTVGEEALAIAEQRLNAVIIFGDKAERSAMRSLITLIDVPSPETQQGRINVYFLENADATELSKVLEGMIKGIQPSKPVAPGSPPISVSPFEAASGITITPDKASNSLVIAASPSDYQSLVQILRQLDRRRRQVFVEAMIVEASIDKLQELGTKWRAVAKHNGEPVFVGGVGKMDSAALTSIITGLTGLTMGGMGNFFNVPVTTVGSDGTPTTSSMTIPGFSAIFSMNEFKDAVNVLSTPQILTSDNKEAEIVVGENVPMVSKRERDVTTTGTVLNSIERKDVGITLRITPQITEGDYVKLDLYQEISALKEDSEEILINVGPSMTKRSTKTSVVVKDGQTVVIGGLMQEKDIENLTKVPVLGDVPVLGYLFKQKSLSKTKTNLLVFLTPRVVKESGSLYSITEEKRKEFAAAQKQYALGELMVKFRDEVTEEKALSIIGQRNASLINIIRDISVYRIKIRDKQSVDEAIEEFLSIPEVQYAEPNYTFKIR